MAHRRLAVLCGHLHQVDRGPLRTLLSPAHCHGDGEKGSSRSEKNCIFCKIVRGQSPAFKAFSYYPQITFLLFGVNFSYGHCCNVFKSALSKQRNNESHTMWCSTDSSLILHVIVKLLVYNNLQTSAADSYNLLVNNGVAAGQTHLHIIPRRADDKLWTTESGFKRKPLKLNQDTDTLAHCVRELISLPPEDGDNCETHELKVGFNSSD